MAKLYFNTSGPCIPGDHYMLPPERRLGRVMELIEQGRYFTLHAGRQTGKTTSARWLVKHYNAGTDRRAIWVDVQTAREQPDVKAAMRTILTELQYALERNLPEVKRLTTDELSGLLADPQTALLGYLKNICAQLSRPLVVLVDEADGLVGPSMVSFLTQLRRGYMDRAEGPCPCSLALIGMRQVRDYVLATEDRQAVSWLGTTSPFNITAEAQTLAPFSCAEVEELLALHTAATGQRFEAEAVEHVSDLSQGHPWLVNALADQVVRDVRDRAVPIGRSHVESARETLILERRTHIDSLMARLNEPRVRRVIAPMLIGDRTGQDVLNDDFAYVLGLGLVTLRGGRYEIANPIYREVIPRALSFDQQAQLMVESAWYVKSDGSLDILNLLAAFQEFWREDGHLAAEGFTYREAGPHLMLMSFLQRVVNGGGRITREYGLGRGALDLLIEWKGERHVVEVKLRRGPATDEKAVRQLQKYLDGLNLTEGWLVIFDLRKTVSWEAKVFSHDLDLPPRTFHIIGC